MNFTSSGDAARGALRRYPSQKPASIMTLAKPNDLLRNRRKTRAIMKIAE